MRSERHICTVCEADLPRTFFSARRDNPMALAFNGLIERELAGEPAGSQAPSELRSLRSLRPLPSSSAPSQSDDLLSTGPSPCPCPGVDRPSGACSQPVTGFQPFSYAAALLYYREDSPYGRIPQALKYGRNFGAGKYFAQMLGREMAASDLFADVHAIVPVPLHWARRWRRGYNQAEILARGIAEELKGSAESYGSAAPVLNRVLRRVRRTGTQTRLHHDDRYANVKSAFEADVKALLSIGLTAGPNDRPLHLLLVDDVFTTGSTLLACERALRRGLAEAFGPADASRVRISVATLSYVGK
ncbi:MAG: hypothetical protein K6F58_01410 [Bacteroidales bacterium]|nr:hypothetical protein [Bacteroidales bacterium]